MPEIGDPSLVHWKHKSKKNTKFNEVDIKKVINKIKIKKEHLNVK